jgi:hypothetical protein
LRIGGTPKFHLFANHVADAEAAVGRDVLTEELVEQSAERIALIRWEQAGAQGLAHLLEKDRREHSLERFARRLWAAASGRHRSGEHVPNRWHGHAHRCHCCRHVPSQANFKLQGSDCKLNSKSEFCNLKSEIKNSLT